jgi:uncharacterized protein YvpB
MEPPFSRTQRQSAGSRTDGAYSGVPHEGLQYPGGQFPPQTSVMYPAHMMMYGVPGQAPHPHMPIGFSPGIQHPSIIPQFLAQSQYGPMVQSGRSQSPLQVQNHDSLTRLEAELQAQQVTQTPRIPPSTPHPIQQNSQELLRAQQHLYDIKPQQRAKRGQSHFKQKASFGELFGSFSHTLFHFIFSAGVPATAIVFMLFLGLQNYSSLLPDITGTFLAPGRVAGASEYYALEEVKLSKSSESIAFLSETLGTDEIPDKASLDVPLIRQEFPLSCEAASLQMALAYYDIDVTQTSLIEEIGVAEPRNLTLVRPGYYIWGDPEVAFVGDINGWFSGERDGQTKLEYGTGWGVHNGPITRVAKQYRPDSEEVDQANPRILKKAISEGYPVLWWHRRAEAALDPITVYTPSGEARIFQEMHVNVLTSYDTDEEGNVTYTFNDPYFEVITLSEEEMLSQWKAHDNEIVIVR